jgi:hypothetical protein
VQKLCNDTQAALEKDTNGNLPIHFVVERKDISTDMIDVILALIRVNPSTMSVKDKDGNLPCILPSNLVTKFQ